MTQTLARNTILVVDDNPDDFFAVQRCLQKSWIDNPVVHCESGEDALELIRQGLHAGTAPMLVLLDINMPGMKGTELLSTLRAMPECGELPILMLTSSDDDRDVMAAFKGRANAYLTKPVTLDKLFDAIQRVGSHRAQIALVPKSEGRQSKVA